MEPSQIQSMLKGLLAEVNPISDRGLILVAVAALDQSLYELLSKAIVYEEERLKERLLGNRGPLESFSSRILAAYCFGLIREDQYLDLQLIRKIRNDCAHSFTNVLLENEPFRSRVSSLKQLDVFPNYLDEHPPDTFLKDLDQFSKDSRGVFLGNVFHLNYGIFFRWVQVKHLKVDSLVDLSNKQSD